MKKSARRTLSLVLTLVLICTLATATFAATTATVDESFYRFDAYAEASIDTRCTTINVVAEGLDDIYSISGNFTCICSYETPSGSITSETFTRTINESDGYYAYTKGYTIIDCEEMRTALYDVDVEIHTESGTYEFAPSSFAVAYP